MEIYLDRRAVRQIRTAAREAMEEGSFEALPEEIFEAFDDEDTSSIEKLLDGIELYDFLSTMLEEWAGDDLDELFELLELQLADIGVDLSTEYQGDLDDTEVLEDEDEFPAPANDFDDDEP
jgi:hypothetical protein